jgi:hypothetical protein
VVTYEHQTQMAAEGLIERKRVWRGRTRLICISGCAIEKATPLLSTSPSSSARAGTHGRASRPCARGSNQTDDNHRARDPNHDRGHAHLYLDQIDADRGIAQKWICCGIADACEIRAIGSVSAIRRSNLRMSV